MKTSDFPHLWDASTNNWVYYAEQNGQPRLYEYANKRLVDAGLIGRQPSFQPYGLAQQWLTGSRKLE